MAIDYSRPFAWVPLHISSIAVFRQHIAARNISWAKGVTLHHTWKPTRAQWRGLASMQGLKKHYLQVEKGTWDSGPHFFLAPDGIWQGTPVTRPGIHAGRCNKDHISFEIVGDYDVERWPMALQAVIFGCADAILDKLTLSVTKETVNGHRECLGNKSCPGRMIDMDEVRNALTIYRRGEIVVEEILPYGTVAVDTRFQKAWELSGAVWKGGGILTPGYAVSKAFQQDGDWYQQFERAMARLRSNGSIEWLLLPEAVRHVG